MSIDRNANNDKRQMRAFQRLRTSAATASISVTAPLLNSGSSISLNLSSTGGLQTSSGALGIKLNTNSGLTLAAGGLSFSVLTTKGDLLTFSTLPIRLAVGANATVLTADSTQATGLKWAAISPLTTKGDIHTFSTVDARLAVGTNGQMIVANSAATTGLSWVSAADASLTFSATGPSVKLLASGGVALDAVNGLFVNGMRSVGTATAVGHMLYDTTNELPQVFDGMFGALPILRTVSSQGASVTAVVNTTTETALPQTVTINTSKLKVGTTIRVKAFGRYSATGTPTIAPRIRLGTTELVDAGPLNVVTNANNKRWFIEGTIRIASGPNTVGGTIDSGGSLAVGDGQYFGTTKNASTTPLNGTSDVLAVTIQWSAASLSNTAVCDLFTVEVLQ